MTILVLSWCLISNQAVCTDWPDRYEFASNPACYSAAQQIAAQNADLKPGYVLHFRCGPPEKEI